MVPLEPTLLLQLAQSRQHSVLGAASRHARLSLISFLPCLRRFHSEGLKVGRGGL